MRPEWLILHYSHRLDPPQQQQQHDAHQHILFKLNTYSIPELTTMRKGWEAVHKALQCAVNSSWWYFSTPGSSLASSPPFLYRCCQKHRPRSMFPPWRLRSAAFQRGDERRFRSCFCREEAQSEQNKRMVFSFYALRTAWCGQTDRRTDRGRSAWQLSSCSATAGLTHCRFIKYIYILFNKRL